MKVWLKRIGIGIAAFAAVIAILGLDYVRSFTRSLPIYNGEINVAGIAAPATITRDRYGVPHIRAASQEDAAFALGYAHAQDRLWQMETSRRFVQGRLAELFGGLATSTDISMRTLGLYQAAEDAVKHLTPQSQRVLLAYAAGVNAYLKAAKKLPIEFSLAGDTPEPWQPADSIAVLKAMAWQLSGNAYEELARAQMLSTLGRSGVESFLAPFQAVPLPAYLDRIYSTTQLGELHPIPDITASNNWVVSGSRSESGKPLVANDPHLGFAAPIVWYLAQMSYPGADLAGGTLAGVPAIIVGHNGHVAWGLTNTGPDTQDIFLEQLSDNGRQYRTPTGWADFETRIETIEVRFAKPVSLTVRISRHGPILPEGNGGGGIAGTPPKGYALAFAWTGLASDDTTFDSVMGINTSANAEDFRTAMRFYVAPMQNIVYADDQGHIGLILPGRVPLRAAGNDSHGLVPAPGWDARYDWQGFVPEPAEIRDPPSGQIATANNKTVPEGYPYQLSYTWDPPYRHDRIAALLDAMPKHSRESFEEIQLDTVDTYALALKSRLNTEGLTGLDLRAAQMLLTWDGRMKEDWPEPLIYAAWGRALAKRIYADEFGAAFPRMWAARAEFTLRVLDNVDGSARWCDDKSTPEVEDCASRVRLALHDAVEELSAAYGPDPAKWRWGDPHKAEFDNQPIGGVPLLGSLVNRTIETDGGAFTVRRADYAMGSEHPYAASHGAGFRGVYDLAEPDKSAFIIATGESGNFYSDHYDDLMKKWSKGEYIEIPSSPEAVEMIAAAKLVLSPRP